ncbi:MAG: TolC family protein, partial [Alphaproteobacteria bacterium]|nr:TolC family protein [Alphaproteobacteria bacterium]
MNTLKQGACCALIAAVLAGTAVAAPCSQPLVAVSAIQAGEPLSLDAVLAEVRNASPEVRKAALETRAREADADQAGRWLNPSIGLELENFSGSGPLAGFDQTETTFSIAQTFQLGGKRSKRQRAARASAALATAECNAILRETELEAVTLFYELDAAVQLVRLADQSAELADTLSETVGKRVDAGAAAPPELSRAKADAAALRAVAAQTRGDMEAL